MTTKSQRAEHLVLVRDLVVLGVTKQIRSREQLQSAATSAQLLTRRTDGRSYGRSSIYRYFDALRFLNLDASTQVSDAISWSPQAAALAERGTATYRQQTLTEEERELLRRCILSSDVSRRFLACFCLGEAVPRTQAEFLAHAHPLYVANESVRRPETFPRSREWPAKVNVEVTLEPCSGKIIRKDRKEFLYTYRYWCLDTGLIDELNVREAERYGITRNCSYVLFPLGPTTGIAQQQFIDALYDCLGDGVTQPHVVPIPWLLYRICPAARIGVETFKSMLLEAATQNPHLLHLERGPGGLIAGNVSPAQLQYRDRYGNHRYYVVVGGTIRSHLVLFPRT